MSNKNNPPRQSERATNASPSVAAPTASVASSPPAVAAEAPKVAPPEPVAPAAPAAPEGFVLARWTGLGSFGGRWYTHPEREERTGCRGPTLGYFDAVSVAKLSGQFESEAKVGREVVLLARVLGAEPPPGHVLARWTGAGRYSGALLSVPDKRPLTHCVGPTVGYFPAESVEKLAGSFEKF